jgi:hypothetical protein
MSKVWNCCILSFDNIKFSSNEFWSKPKGQSFDEDPQFEELEFEGKFHHLNDEWTSFFKPQSPISAKCIKVHPRTSIVHHTLHIV